MRKLATCGTRSAYQRHVRYAEAPCEPCRQASRAYARSRYPSIKEKENARNKIYRQNNSEKERLRRKKYAEEHLEQEKARNKQYYRDNPGKYSAEKHRRRRAQKRNNGFEFYKTEEVVDLYGTDCHICLKPIDMDAPRAIGKGNWELSLHIDHVVPISKGGPDVLDNVRPAHAICNLKKQDNIELK